MIPFIRSFSELMATTNSRDSQNITFRRVLIDDWPESCGQRKRYDKSISIYNIELPDLSKSIKHKWLKKKKKISRFFEKLDYNNQIQSSYDLMLQERQNNNILKDAA